MKYDLKRNRPYEFSLAVELDGKDLGYYLEEAKKQLANNLKIKGFRQGKAPFEVAKDNLDKKLVLSTAFDIAFKQSFADVLEKEKLEIIDVGKFEVKENSLNLMAYSVLLTVYPDLKLADYENIKIKRDGVSVSKEEVDKAIEFMRSSRKQDGVVPELNDEFAKGLGQFENLEGLRKSVEEGIKEEKEVKESQRIQSSVLEKIAEGTKVEIPPVLIGRQTDQMMLDLDADLTRQGMEFGLFLAKIKKTKDELINEWKPKAEMLVKKALIMKEIAKREGIKIEPAEVEERMGLFLRNFGGIEEVRKNIDLAKLADQIRQILLNQKVLAFLEKEAVN